MKRYMRIHKNDNVAVMLYDAKAGDAVALDGRTVVLKEEIPYGHKVSLEDLEAGAKVIKYGQPIGCTTENVAEGEWLHIHNMKSLRGGEGR